ncbi:hypothetical protein, partial [Parabacteroides sp.]
VYQEWDDNGDIWHSNYNMQSEYYIIFNEDFTGSTHSGEDELMEWKGTRKFNWSLDKGIIYNGSDVPWKVKSISANELELVFLDTEDNGEWYRITCKFKRKE